MIGSFCNYQEVNALCMYLIIIYNNVYTERVLTRVTCLGCALKLWIAMLSNLQT